MAVGFLKAGLSILFANALRFLRIIPNNDPIMGIMLPFAKQESVWIAILFPIITMVSFDFITFAVGPWTVVTSLTYGALGLFFYFFYKKIRKGKVGMKTYLGSGVFGVLVFDFVTGVLATPFMFHMSFEQAFLGQIPFTLMHLATATGYILIVTPLLDKHILGNPVLDDKKFISYISRLFPKIL